VAAPEVSASPAPGDLYPIDSREAHLCDAASRPDWLYLGGLVVLDTGAIALGSSFWMKWQVQSDVARLTGPALIGLTWGATVGGAWLALPKCSTHWLPRRPPDGAAHQDWPLAVTLALLAGATAPLVNAIAVGFTLPPGWSTEERAAHLVVAGVAGFGASFLPYLLPPKTWSAFKELQRLQVGVDARSLVIGYEGSF
jgi:hypothetical protein